MDFPFWNKRKAAPVPVPGAFAAPQGTFKGFVVLPAFVDTITLLSPTHMEVQLLLRVDGQPGFPLKMNCNRRAEKLFPLHEWIEFKLEGDING